MEYKKIKNAQQLLEYMDENIVYGVYDYENNIKHLGNCNNFENYVANTWKLSSPTNMIEHGIGICYDQVELERDFFKKQGYVFKTFFIWFKCNRANNYPTHTYLVFKDKNTSAWYWFEHSDFNNKGIHKYNSLNEAIIAQKTSHIKFAKSYRKSKTDASKIEIFEYDNIAYGTKFGDFIDTILKTGKRV